MTRVGVVTAIVVLIGVLVLFHQILRPTFATLVAYKKSLPVVEKEVVVDLNQNQIPEKYFLRDGVLTVIEADQQLWRSPSGWWIDDFALVDVTNDGQTDISLSVWKEGDYGPSKPFWVKENNQDVRNHFFIFDLIDNQVQPVWQSSNLSVPNCTFHIADTNQDGKNELLVTEGDYKNWPACIGLYSAGWQWNGWGFTNEWRRVKPRAD